MKRVLPFLLFPILMASCDSAQKPAAEPEVQVKAAAAPVDPVVQKKQALSAMSSIGLDELSAYLPSELNGMKRTNLTMSSELGYAKAHADYIKNNKTDIRVNVFDLAGEAGVNMYQSRFVSPQAAPVENEQGYTRTIDLNGGKAVEHYDKNSKTTTITYISGERVLVEMAARNISPEDLKAAAQKITR